MHHWIFQVANVDEVDTLSEEDEAVASDLDLHALIVAPNHGDLDSEPVQSAEEVIKEIDDLMQVRFFFLNAKYDVTDVVIVPGSCTDRHCRRHAPKSRYAWMSDCGRTAQSH